MERTLLHADNAYYFPHAEFNGQVCFTNYPPNTAFRGFGGPQAVAAMENIMQRIAEHLDIDSLDVRMKNLYGDATSQRHALWAVDRAQSPGGDHEQLARSSDYRQRLKKSPAANAKRQNAPCAGSR